GLPACSAPSAAGPTRAEWRTLLCIDQHRRWHRGDRVPVEAYLRDHPWLRADDGLLDLIFGEAALRQSLGENPSLDEHVGRFRQHEPRLRDQLPSCLGPPSLAPTRLDAEGGLLWPGAADANEAGWPAVPGYEIVRELGRGGM